MNYILIKYYLKIIKNNIKLKKIQKFEIQIVSKNNKLTNSTIK